MTLSKCIHLAALAALPALLAGCQTVAGTDAGVYSEWGYEGESRAENWGSLSPDYALCKSGAMQSPINLAGAKPADIPDPIFQYQPTPLTVENLGHTAQVNYASGSSMILDGVRYELLQFHFHTPSEHRVDGREYPAELHLVHRGPTGNLAVLGVLLAQGSENSALRPLVDNLPEKTGAKQSVGGVQIDADDLLPTQAQHYTYEGSLTTPPCTEGVKWLVVDRPIQASAEQLRRLMSVIGVSNRPVQPLGARELLKDTR
jgi:carbonic anhydrase